MEDEDDLDDLEDEDDALEGDDYADQFDEVGGEGAWPGMSADDAQPGDFEDTVGDVHEDLGDE